MNDILFYKQLEVMANIGWWSFDLKKSKLLWSDQTYKIHGVSVGEEIEVSSAINFYVEEDRPIIESAFKNCVENNISYDLKLRIRDQKGIVKWVQAHGKALMEGDEVVMVFGTFQDIDKQIRVENKSSELNRQLESYKLILDEFAIAPETDLRGTITYANKKFCESSKYKKEELVGQNHQILNSGFHTNDFFKLMWESISKGIPWSGRICNKNKLGEHYWVETYISPIYNASKEITGYFSLRFDITERVHLQKQVETEKEIATFNAQLASVGEMSANIAHDIANPLTIITGRNNILMKSLNDEEKLEASQQSIAKALARYQKIIIGLKRLSKNSLNENFESVSLSSLGKETLDYSMESLKSHLIEIHHDTIDESIFVECREIQISQVLLNLINNARDAIQDKESSKKWIKVEFSDLGDSIRLCIIDSGPGIASNIKGKIMDSFFTTKKVGKGTGLGLSLANRFVKEHNGKIYLAENVSHTTFVIELPKLQTNQEIA